MSGLLMGAMGILFGGFCVEARAQNSPKTDCRVEIAEPKSGERIGRQVLISGRAEIPADAYLWVFAHREGLATWWPQGSGAATIEDKTWSVPISFGDPGETGAFEVTAVPVDADTNLKLEAWRRDSESEGRYLKYLGMQLPAVAEGCGRPPRITLTKIENASANSKPSANSKR